MVGIHVCPKRSIGAPSTVTSRSPDSAPAPLTRYFQILLDQLGTNTESVSQVRDNELAALVQ